MKLKKILSIIMAAVLLLSLAACSTKDKDNSNKPSDGAEKLQLSTPYTDLVEKNKVSKKFKTDNGSVYFKIDFCLPHFDTEDTEVKRASTLLMNAAFEEILDDSVEFAENNVSEVLASRERENSKKLYWERTCDFTVTGENEDYISFLLEFSYSTQSGENASVYHKALVFDLESGAQVLLPDFSSLEEYRVRSRLATKICADIANFVTPENEEPRYFENIDEPYLFDLISPANFYFSPDGLTVYFDRGLVSPDYRGTAFFTYSFDEVREILDLLPEVIA